MTTMTLNDAIENLQTQRDDLAGAMSILGAVAANDNVLADMVTSNLVALDLAIAVLTEKAEVSPARRTDPATSHRAAPEEIKAGSAREKILLAAENTASPLTARELSYEAGLGHQRSPWKRVSELVKAGFLKAVGVGIDTESGAHATTYAITAKGRAACTGLRDRMGAS
jgi:hypothetical protein